MVPSLIFVVSKQSSLAVGLFVANLLLLSFLARNFLILKLKKNSFLFFCFVMIVLMSNAIYSFLVFDEGKPLFSILPLLVMVVTAYLFSEFLVSVKVEALTNSLFLILTIILFLGYLKLIYVPETLGYIKEIAVFPFSENSHFALVFGMFAVAYSFVGSWKLVFFILVNLQLLAFLYPSLTLVVFSLLVLLSFFLRLKAFYFKISVAFVFPVFVLLVFAFMYSLEYFASRLTFHDTQNLTTLVFLQGWELSYLNFINTNGFGLGFQMLGSVNTTLGGFSDLIVKINSNVASNIHDGGFLAAKIIAEFGIVGLFFILFYFYFLIKLFFKSNVLVNKDFLIDKDKKILIMYGFLFSFFVEMFFRGYGYFSPGLFMFMTAFFALLKLKNIKMSL
jgi:hypothetical protein